MNDAQKVQEVINRLDNFDIEKGLGKVEKNKLEAWKESHYQNCNGAYDFFFTFCSIGTNIYVRCSYCATLHNITDYDGW